ncbi:MAG: hypothetical protein GXO44_01790 [Deferribacteres bacterium]|nr:hypothetical protein [Deferribacteres bacterium]
MGEDRDIKKLRIAVISFLVASFIFTLILLKLGARHLGVNKGDYMPLLELLKPEYPVIDGSNVKLINGSLGKVIIIDDKVKSVSKEGGLFVVKLTYVTLPLDEGQFAFLEQINGRKIKPHVRIKACGRLEVDPHFGLSLKFSDVCYRK